VTKKGERSFWQPIEEPGPQKWLSFNAKLDYLPFNGVEIFIRKLKVEEANYQRARPSYPSGLSSGDPFPYTTNQRI
jgi:hypothetical protein